MILDGVVPFVRGELEAGGQVQAGWLLLDTGAYTSILQHDRLSSTSKFADEFRRLLGPLGVLGNDVLKRLNMVVDNRLGAVYLRANDRLTDPFRNPERVVVRAAAIAAIVGVATMSYRRLR